MVSYLHIQHGTESKRYALTDTANKPYIEVGNVKLPLIDGTVSGLHLGVGVAGGGETSEH